MFNRRRDEVSGQISISIVSLKLTVLILTVSIVFLSHLAGEHFALLQLLVPGRECRELRLRQAVAGPRSFSSTLRAERAAGAEAGQRRGLGPTPLAGRVERHRVDFGRGVTSGFRTSEL